MNPLKNLDIVKKTISTLIALSAFSFIGCENPVYNDIVIESEDVGVHIYGSDTDTTEVTEDTLSSVIFNLLLDLELDGNGFYHLPIDTTKWQTLHRLTSVVTRDSVGVNVIKVSWYSNHYWLIGDTLGYMIENTGSDDLWYVGYDTTYITWFNGFEVPVINGASYSDMHGEVNTMIAPVKTMRGDTISIGYSYYDDWKLEETVGEFSIVLD
mgnify:FL=1|tara:strand:- start:716 stop:1348 length:633 start_codon:yes stop_codon:yes gene_type:complete